MYLGFTFEKLLLIALIAALIVGPARLPGYAAALGRGARGVRDIARIASARVKDELGPDFEEIDWKTLDPRQYDPRQIVRNALLDDGTESPASTAAASDDPGSPEHPFADVEIAPVAPKIMRTSTGSPVEVP